MADRLYNLLKPGFNSLTAESTFVDVSNILAKGLRNWFKTTLTKQISNVNGTVTYPNGATTTIVNQPALREVNTNLPFTGAGIMAALANGETGFASLYQYIGVTLTATSIIWNGLPYFQITSSSIPVTTHFYTLGTMLYAETSILKAPETEDESLKLTEKIWSLFEKYLKLGINSIPIQVVPCVGSMYGGVFNGTAIIKFSC